MPNIDEQKKKWIEDQIKREGLNPFGDPKSTVYTGGTPLLNEMTGKVIDRFDYILSRHKDWLPK